MIGNFSAQKNVFDQWFMMKIDKTRLSKEQLNKKRNREEYAILI